MTPLWHSVTGSNGWRGGAILIMNGSFMKLYSNVSIMFYKNTAILSGGVIFAEVSAPFDYLESHIYFLWYYREEKRLNEWNVTLNFISNNSTRYVNIAIFSSTLQLCKKEYSDLKFLPNFYYTPPFSRTTLPSKINVSNSTIQKFPGENFQLPVNLTDELNQPVPAFVLTATCHGRSVATCSFALSIQQWFHANSIGKPTDTCLLN